MVELGRKMLQAARGVPVVFLPLTFTALLYIGLPRNHFMGDDFVYLYRSINCDWLEYLLTPHGGHLLIVRNAVFWLFRCLFGTHAALYFAAVLLTHLLNVFLLFQVIRLQGGSSALACFGAALWGTCRLNDGTLGWYSVYGQVLAATCLLWLLLFISRIASGEQSPRFGKLGCALAVYAGATCFGVGLAVALVAPLLAWLLLPASHTRVATVLVLVAVAVSVPLLYIGVQHIYTSAYGGQSNVPLILSTLRHPDLVATLVGHLALYGVTRLCLGVFFSPEVYLNTTAVLTGVIVLAAVVATFIGPSSKVRRRLAAYLMLTVVSYASVAVGRAGLRQADLVGAATEPRWHYIALLALTFVLCELLGATARFTRSAHAPMMMIAALATALLSYDPFLGEVFDPRGSAVETRNTLAALRSLTDTQSTRGPVCIANRGFRAAGLSGHVLFPGWAAVYVIFEPANTIDGRPIYFIEKDRDTLSAAARGRRSAGLILSPEQGERLGCSLKRH